MKLHENTGNHITIILFLLMGAHFLENILIWGKAFGYFLAVLVFDKIGIPSTQLAALGFLMFTDVFTGYLKAKKVDPLAFTSQRLTDGVVKKLLILVVIFSLAILAQYGVNIEIDEFLKWAFGILMVAETYSIIQNVYVHRTGIMVKEYDAVRLLLKALGDFLLVLFNKLLQVISTK